MPNVLNVIGFVFEHFAEILCFTIFIALILSEFLNRLGGSHG